MEEMTEKRIFVLRAPQVHELTFRQCSSTMVHPVVDSDELGASPLKNSIYDRKMTEKINAAAVWICHRTGRPKRCKDVIKRDMAGFHISPRSWETLAADRER